MLTAVLPVVLGGGGVVVVKLEVVVELDDVFNEPPHAASVTPAEMMIAKTAAFAYFFNRLPFVTMLAMQHPRTTF